MTDIRKGDRVRVTFEAVLRNENSLYASFSDEPGGKWVGEVTIDLANIEKIEPPVEVFKPGDVVRPLRGDRAMRVLGESGYISVPFGRQWTYGKDGAYEREEFTSRHFERVSINSLT